MTELSDGRYLTMEQLQGDQTARLAVVPSVENAEIPRCGQVLLFCTC